MPTMAFVHRKFFLLKMTKQLVGSFASYRVLIICLFSLGLLTKMTLGFFTWAKTLFGGEGS